VVLLNHPSPSRSVFRIGYIYAHKTFNMRFSSTLTAGAFVTVSSAQIWLGFNSGSMLPDSSAKFEADFEAEFTTAQNLVGAPGKFNAVRLYTNIQAYSQDDPIQAFQAAIKTNTSILLGVWASGTTSIDNEINALKKAVDQYGQPFIDLVIAVSIGSEDLYRNSVVGISNKAGIGNQPEAIVGFINDFRNAFANTPLASKPIGHVDTWDVWPNATNNPVLDAVDWIGVDEYPYFENGKGNDIKNAPALFDKAYNAVVAVAGSKPVWVTETGWPVSGPNWDQAVPSVANAQYYWDNIGCRSLFGKIATFWYTLRDANTTDAPSFEITQDLSTTPTFNLTCPTTFDVPSTTGSGSSNSSTKSGTSSDDSSNGSGSSSSSGSAASPSSSKNASARAVQMLPAAGYAGLALVAGIFSLF
jgi:glucan endo-1,3-beta-D-glucosidase